MIRIINGCYDYHDRAESLSGVVVDIANRLRLADTCTRRINVVMVDHDPVTEGCYKGGGNYTGHDESVVLIYVWDSIHMSNEAMTNLIAHEMRHAFQTVYDVTFTNATPPTNNEDYQKYHDMLPEEVDADKWAEKYSGFDGVAWWKEMERMEREGK